MSRLFGWTNFLGTLAAPLGQAFILAVSIFSLGGNLARGAKPAAIPPPPATSSAIPAGDAPADHAAATTGQNVRIGSSENRPLRFHRTFVPAESVKDWPRGNVRYLPMDADEFASLLKRMASHAVSGPPSEQVQVEHAQYAARLEGETLVDGSASLDIRRNGAGASGSRASDSRTRIVQPGDRKAALGANGRWTCV